MVERHIDRIIIYRFKREIDTRTGYGVFHLLLLSMALNKSIELISNLCLFELASLFLGVIQSIRRDKYVISVATKPASL